MNIRSQSVFDYFYFGVSKFNIINFHDVSIGGFLIFLIGVVSFFI
jgi:hypothetical protein